MAEYVVQSHVGVGQILFGMTRDEVRSLMGGLPVTFHRSVAEDPAIDAFFQTSFQISYDNDDRVEFIELARDPTLTVLYKGHDVFMLTAEELVQLVSQDAPYDPNDPELGFSYTFLDLDIALWRATVPEDEDDPDGRFFDSISVGRQGYFGKSDA